MTRDMFEGPERTEIAVASSKPPRRSGLLPILLGGVAVLVVVVLGAVVVQGWGGQQIAQPDPSATPGPSASAEAPSDAPSPTAQVVAASASATPPGGPIEVVLRAGEPGTTQTVTGIAEGPLGGVATVTVYPFGEIPPVGTGENPDGAIYLESPDGTWSLLDTGATFDGVYLGSVKAAADGSLVAYGGISVSSDDARETTGIWVSSDGRAWTEVAEAPPRAAPLGHVRAHFDMAARAITVFASPDAVTWELVFTRPVEDALVRDVGSGPEGFVIVAEEFSGEQRVPIVLASPDGREWFEAPTQASLLPDSILVAVEPIGTDWLAAGFEPGESGGIATWWSANGLEWEKAATITSDAPSFGFPSGLQSSANRLVLSAAQAIEGALPRNIGTWTSANGTTWDQVPLGQEAGVGTLLDRGDRVLLGGRMGWTDGHAMIWSWDPHSRSQAGAAPMTWEEGTAPRGAADVLRVTDRWLAVGATTEGDGGLGRAAAWTSDDGLTWAPTTPIGPEPVRTADDWRQYRMTTALDTGGRILAVGWSQIGCCDSGRPMLWRSEDGLAWEEIDLRGTAWGDTYHHPSALIPHGDELVMLSGEGLSGQAVAWVSPDGGSWTRHPIATGESTVSLLDVASGGGELLAVGFQLGAGEQPEQAPAMWRSTDGRSWAALSVPPGAKTLSSIAYAEDLNRFTVVGQGVDGQGAAWSGNANGWTQSNLSEGAGHGAVVRAAGSLIVAVGTADGSAVAWPSRDGVQWAASPLASTGTAVELVLAVAAGSAVAIADPYGTPWDPQVEPDPEPPEVFVGRPD